MALVTSLACVARRPEFRVVSWGTTPMLIPPHAFRQVRFSKGPASETCIERSGITVHQTGPRSLAFHVANNADSKEPSGWLLTYAAALEAAGCVPPDGGLPLAHRLSDALPETIEKSGVPTAGDFTDAGTQDLSSGFTLRMVEPILRAGAASDAPLIGPGTGDDARASRDLVGMRTAWYKLEGGSDYLKSRLVYVKEEVKIFDHAGPNPQLPPRLTELLPPDLTYFKLLTIVRHTTDADRGEILIASATLPGLIARADTARRQGNCGTLGPDQGCLMVRKGAFISPLINVEVNGIGRTLSPDSRLREVIDSANPKPANLRVWKRDQGRLLPVDFHKAASAILDLQLTGGERITYAP